MTTQEYIDQNKTETFKKGDSVVMHNCYEATLDKYIGIVWECKTDSYKDRAGQECVFLVGFSGCFSAEYLIPVLDLPPTKWQCVCGQLWVSQDSVCVCGSPYDKKPTHLFEGQIKQQS